MGCSPWISTLAQVPCVYKEAVQCEHAECWNFWKNNGDSAGPYLSCVWRIGIYQLFLHVNKASYKTLDQCSHVFLGSSGGRPELWRADKKLSDDHRIPESRTRKKRKNERAQSKPERGRMEMCADVCGSPASHGMCTHRHPCPPFSSLLWIQAMQRGLRMSIVSKLQVIGAEPRVWFQTHLRTGTKSKSFLNPIPILGLKKLELVLLLHFSRDI